MRAQRVLGLSLCLYHSNSINAPKAFVRCTNIRILTLTRARFKPTNRLMLSLWIVDKNTKRRKKENKFLWILNSMVCWLQIHAIHTLCNKHTKWKKRRKICYYTDFSSGIFTCAEKKSLHTILRNIKLLAHIRALSLSALITVKCVYVYLYIKMSPIILVIIQFER